jgi:membrane-anchored protein YejM (alkaline phosphatase superfamily)
VPAVAGERVLPAKKVNVKCQNSFDFQRKPSTMRSFALFLALISLVSASEKPNVLFIFADDMTYEAIGSLGMTEVMTPNLDKLFSSGTQFTHAYNSGGLEWRDLCR